jgi:hypothetical protein
MTVKKRAALIICGIIIFSLAAPAAIFFARGYYFDFSTRRIVQTGTLAVKTDPRGASVSLNGAKLKDATPIAVRFLTPGEYELTIQKQGYQSWKKTVNIRGRFVTYVPSGDRGKIFLLTDAPQAATLATNTREVLMKDGGVFALAENKIYEYDPANGSHTLLTATSTLATAQNLFDEKPDQSGSPTFLIGDKDHLEYLDSTKILDLSANFSKAQFWVGNSVLILTGKKQLEQFDLATGQTQIIGQNVLDFTVQVDSLGYLARSAQNSNNVELLQLSSNGQTKTVIANLPHFSQSQIIRAPTGQLFLLLDKDLYQVGDNLNKINSQVTYVRWDSELPGLVYGNFHEAWIYSTDKIENQLVTRSSENLGPAWYTKKTGYVFVVVGQTLDAIEVDPAGQSNVYPLAKVQNSDTQFSVSSAGDTIIYLDGVNLKSLKIR